MTIELYYKNCMMQSSRNTLTPHQEGVNRDQWKLYFQPKSKYIKTQKPTYLSSCVKTSMQFEDYISFVA
jgi:hypothetical protein